MSTIDSPHRALYLAIQQLKAAHLSITGLYEQVRLQDATRVSELKIASDLTLEAVSELLQYQARLFREQGLAPVTSPS